MSYCLGKGNAIADCDSSELRDTTSCTDCRAALGTSAVSQSTAHMPLKTGSTELDEFCRTSYFISE